MRKLGAFVGIAITISLLALPATLLAQESDPAAICYDTERMQAFHAGDMDTVLEAWADDAVQTIVVGDGVETYTGKDQIQTYWLELLAGGFSMEATVLSVESNTVTAESKTWSDDTRALGVAPLVGTEVCVVEDGKIQSMTWTLSDDSLAALPQTGGQRAPGYAWIVALGGLTLAAGLGSGLPRRRARHRS
jgi:hypothetical protein